MQRKRNTSTRASSHSKTEFIQEAHFQSAAVPEFSGVGSTALPVAAAAEALISAVLFGCLPASTLPRSSAPSSIARRSVCTSPMTCPVLHSWTLSRPVTFPSILPRTITSRALTSAFTCPLGPTVRQLLVVRLSFPSTTPSTNRSSLPVSSPLIFIPWLMHAAARDDVGSAPDSEGALAGTGLNELAELGAVGRLLGTTSDFASSFFHIGHLDIEN